MRLSDLGGLVYSTDAGRMCPGCRQAPRRLRVNITSVFPNCSPLLSYMP